MSRKRLILCVLGGLVAAVLCFGGWFVIFGFPEITTRDLAGTIANRILLGFVIGISSWRIHPLVHGAVLGLLVSLSVSIGMLPHDPFDFGLYTTMGVLYGVVIEWLMTRVFNAPMASD